MYEGCVSVCVQRPVVVASVVHLHEAVFQSGFLVLLVDQVILTLSVQSDSTYEGFKTPRTRVCFPEESLHTQVQATSNTSTRATPSVPDSSLLFSVNGMATRSFLLVLLENTEKKNTRETCKRGGSTWGSFCLACSITRS